jgi:hypothetical protein
VPALTTLAPSSTLATMRANSRSASRRAAAGSLRLRGGPRGSCAKPGSFTRDGQPDGQLGLARPRRAPCTPVSWAFSAPSAGLEPATHGLGRA